ncbi:carbohydrate ABC transporter permease [Zobellella maritima]|uniref:carbohydrate ABC transporter permease n=1 Tax=Zobellella maritima TaxID=2059725 RepID=UPI000E307988|nr:sugar ABC transporter permease [Zobellella maritima]
MKFKTFALFVAPSVLAMLLLIAVPLAGVAYISVFNASVQTELVEVTTKVPVFAGVEREVTKMVPQPVLDEQGNPVRNWEYVGMDNIKTVVDPDGLSGAFTQEGSDPESSGRFLDNLADIYYDIVDIDFWGALEFTLLYTFVTTPLVLLLGFALAMTVDNAVKKMKGVVIFASLLPFIVTPLIGSLSIYWLFLDNSVITSLLQQMGLGKIYFMKDAFTIRALIILYGIWHVTPFAFVIFYAGLQTVNKDSLEAAVLDGASAFDRVRYIIVPHLMPLVVFVAMMHIMDAYRIFEPVLVFGSNLFANSLQYLTFYTLNFEDNFNKAAASSLLTVLGVVILLIPALTRNWREHKRGY